jgi:hypothetical protein
LGNLLERASQGICAFTKKHGRIKEFTAYERTTTKDEGEKTTVVYRRFKWDRLLFDVEAPLVESLERITDAGEIEDGPFLKGRTLNKPVRPKIEPLTMRSRSRSTKSASSTSAISPSSRQVRG